MLTSLPRRVALVIAFAASLAAPSAAAADTLQIDFLGPELVEGVPAPLHVAASADPILLFTRVSAKPMSPDADCSDGPVIDSGRDLFLDNGDVIDVTTSVVFDHAGPWLVCAWARPFPPAPDVVETLEVVVRPSRATVSIAAPAAAREGAPVTLSFDVAAEAPRRLLYAVVRGSRCGRGADAARALGARVRPLPGAVTTERRTAVVRFPSRGRWRVCAYVQRDAGPGVANAVAGRDIRIGGRRRAHGGRPHGEFGG